MQLNSLLSLLGKSFGPRNDGSSVSRAAGGERAGFGSLLTAAFGLKPDGAAVETSEEGDSASMKGRVDPAIDPRTGMPTDGAASAEGLAGNGASMSGPMVGDAPRGAAADALTESRNGEESATKEQAEEPPVTAPNAAAAPLETDPVDPGAQAARSRVAETHEAASKEWRGVPSAPFDVRSSAGNESQNQPASGSTEEGDRPAAASSTSDAFTAGRRSHPDTPAVTPGVADAFTSERRAHAGTTPVAPGAGLRSHAGTPAVATGAVRAAGRGMVPASETTGGDGDPGPSGMSAGAYRLAAPGNSSDAGRDEARPGGGEHAALDVGPAASSAPKNGESRGPVTPAGAGTAGDRLVEPGVGSDQGPVRSDTPASTDAVRIKDETRALPHSGTSTGTDERPRSETRTAVSVEETIDPPPPAARETARDPARSGPHANAVERADAAPSASSVEGILNAGRSDLDPFVGDFSVEEPIAHAEIRSGDAVFSPEPRATAAGSTASAGAHESAGPRSPSGAAWLRSILTHSARAIAFEQGWKTIEIQLDEGQGTMTVKARRGDDGLSISVGFSDPDVRLLAEANAHRLQDALRTEYDSNVDLSLMSDGSADNPSSRNRSGTSGPHRIDAGTGETSGERSVENAPNRRPAPAGVRNEWIG